jgi:CRP/FNR family transcriptional regulator
MRTEDVAALLAQAPMFKGLPTDCVWRLAAVSRVVWFKAGEMLFAQGQDAAGLYIVASGRVCVTRRSPDGKEQTLRVWEPWDMVGEVALFAGRTYPAFGQAQDDGHAVLIPRDGLLKAVADYPDLALSLLGVLSGRLRILTDLVEGLSLRDVPSRLATWLLERANATEQQPLVELRVSKQRLASILGTLPETLSRVLRKMQDEGLIEGVDNRSMRLLDRDRLEAISAGKVRVR